jgi:hypothetical protein
VYLYLLGGSTRKHPAGVARIGRKSCWLLVNYVVNLRRKKMEMFERQNRAMVSMSGTAAAPLGGRLLLIPGAPYGAKHVFDVPLD